MRHVSNAIMEVSRSRENAHAVLLVERFDGGRFAERPDFVVQEVSIEVFLDGRPTFRGTCSPWDVEDLVVGRLFLEGAIVEMSCRLRSIWRAGVLMCSPARVAVGPGTGASSCHLAACRGVLRQACRSRRARCPTCRWRLPR